jgi:hypothetical protein
MELCQASFACWNFNVVPRFGPVAQESVVDSALLRSIFRPFKPAFLYTSRTQIASGDAPQVSA